MGRASCRERVEISVGLESMLLLFRSLLVQLAARRVRALHRPGIAARDRPGADRARPGLVDRWEERRVGKEWRSRWDWSPCFCSSVLCSFNPPHGACERCTGLGSQREIDPELIVPDPALSIAEGALAPRADRSSRCYAQLIAASG